MGPSETGPCSPNERGPCITEDDGELVHDEESPHGVGVLEDDGAVPEETQASYARPIRFPISRLKTIAKTVSSVHLINSESLAVLSRATEKFIVDLAVDAARMAAGSGRKTVSKGSFDTVIATLPQYEFLDGMLD
ncbi:DNA polymerase epsilon subunit 4 [Sparganum proliferum]